MFYAEEGMLGILIQKFEMKKNVNNKYRIELIIKYIRCIACILSPSYIWHKLDIVQIVSYFISISKSTAIIYMSQKNKQNKQTKGLQIMYTNIV